MTSARSKPWAFSLKGKVSRWQRLRGAAQPLVVEARSDARSGLAEPVAFETRFRELTMLLLFAAHGGPCRRLGRKEVSVTQPQFPPALPQPAPGPQPGVQPHPPRRPVQAAGPKVIATLPPIEELNDEVPLSPRTGQPRRPAVLLVAAVLSYLAASALALSYAIHWWDAVHPDTYPTSARLIEWVDPDPGKWLSLTLEVVLAAAAVVAAGATAVAGFQAWNGWRWARWAGPVAVALVGAFALVVNNWALVGVGLAAVSAALVFLPPVSRYLGQWDRVRSEQPERYRRPAWIFYGRLPRFR